MLLARGNRKLGRGVWSFSIPALTTCPGKTHVCSRLCYAAGGHFSWPSNLKLYERNLRATRLASFAPRVIREIRQRRIRVLRIHCGGDMYSIAYVRKWLRIARQCPGTVFFGYSRSWWVPSLVPALRALAALPNVFLWASLDRDRPRPPRLPEIHGSAYMSEDDGDLPGRRVDLVFRNEEKTAMKYTPGGDFVCPYEQGVKRQKAITCDKCKYCFNQQELRQRRAGGRLAKGGRTPLRLRPVAV